MYTVQVHPAIYRIATPYEGGGVVYLYLIKGDRLALVDTGVSGSPREVLPAALAEIGLNLADVDLVLCTHGHLDHAGGNPGVKAASGATIRMHQAEVPLSQDVEAEVDFHLAPLRALDFPASFLKARAEYLARNAGVEKVPVDATLADGEVVHLGKGIKITAIHVPGHTPGHMVFFWETEGILLTGDAIQGQALRPGGYPYYFDASRYRRSLSLMEALPYQTLCLGHAFIGGSPISSPTRKGPDARAFIQESMRVADAVHAAVSAASRALPGATRREIALAALSDLVYDLPQQRLRETEMPAHAGPSLFAHIKAVEVGGYPE